MRPYDRSPRTPLTFQSPPTSNGIVRLFGQHARARWQIRCHCHARAKLSFQRLYRRFILVLYFRPAPWTATDVSRVRSGALNDEERCQHRQAQSVPVLKAFKAWLDIQVHAVLPKSALGRAVFYALKNWDALCLYTEQGYLEPDNNFAEQILRPVAVGRKAFPFVGSERAGRAAAIYYSLVESCKLNKVNPLTYLPYLTYALSHVRDRRVTLLTPDEFNASNITQIG